MGHAEDHPSFEGPRSAVGDDMDARIDALVAQARPAEAAALASQTQQHDRAAQLYEQACDFALASDQAVLAGDWRRAVVLAALAGDPQRIKEVQNIIVQEPNRARAAAEELRARGHGSHAARILELVGDLELAAATYADATMPVEAADIYESLGQDRQAARVLESAHRSNPRDTKISLRLAQLLVKHRRYDVATRVLHSMDASCSERKAALPLVAACYEALGLDAPLSELRREADALGVELETTDISCDDSLETIVYGRYEIIRDVAVTPTARVFEALDRVTQQRVAIKQLQAEGLAGAGRDAFARMTREATALEQLRHPNVVPLVELVAKGGAVITSWMAGGSLADMMNRERIAPMRAVEIAAAMLSALGEAHRLGILHRDVKPSNILFDDAGVPRLSDFGAAHVSDTSATATAGVIGTLAYMSPAQRYGQPATTASDVYGVGATLCEMLTGRPPPVTGQALHPPSRCHPDLRAEHDDAISALVAKESLARAQTALDARKRLLELRWPMDNRGQLLPRGQQQEQEDLTDRLQPLEPGIYFDVWTSRRVRIVGASEKMRHVARAYATLTEPAISRLLRFDSQQGEYWFEIPNGPLLSELAQELSEQHRTLLSNALQALHQQGVTHGSVDASHIAMRGGSVVLLFDPKTMQRTTPQQDLEALSRIA